METEKLCPFKKAVDREYSPVTGKTTLHERFEVWAQHRCMAYRSGKCLRLEGKRHGT